MRIILKCNRYTPIKVMLNTLNLLSVKQFVVYRTLLCIYKIRTGLLPSYLLDKIILVQDIHDHNTRQVNDFYVEN